MPSVRAVPAAQAAEIATAPPDLAPVKASPPTTTLTSRRSPLPRLESHPAALQLPAQRPAKQLTVLARTKGNRVGPRRGVDLGHLSDLLDAAVVDTDFGQAVGDADFVAQVQHPVEYAGEARLGQVEVARQALHLWLDAGAVGPQHADRLSNS